jgi:hypothetical protein
LSAPCLALDATGRQVAVPLRLVAGPEAVATKIRIRLDSIRGQWIEDLRIGLPVLEWQDNPAIAPVVIEGVVRQQVRQVDGVLSVERVTVSKVGDTLSIAVVCSVDSDAGPVRVAIQSEDETPLPGPWFLFLSRANPLLVGR